MKFFVYVLASAEPDVICAMPLSQARKYLYIVGPQILFHHHRMPDPVRIVACSVEPSMEHAHEMCCTRTVAEYLKLLHQRNGTSATALGTKP
jgi:hypothetical protein